MSEHDETHLWDQIDAGFHQVVQDDKVVADHAHVSRDDLERHMRDAHGVMAMTHGQVVEGVYTFTVAELTGEGEARLRAAHWNLHECGMLPHRPAQDTEAGR